MKTSHRTFTLDEMVDMLSQFLDHPFTTQNFTELFEAFCEGGDNEDPGIEADLRKLYPNLCAGAYEETEWAGFVSNTFWNLYDRHILVPGFPRD